jgi:hypothetical protein
MKNGVRTLVIAVSLSLASAPLFAAHVGGSDPHPQAVSGGNPHPQAVSGGNPHPQAVSGGNPHPQSSTWIDLLLSLFSR